MNSSTVGQHFLTEDGERTNRLNQVSRGLSLGVIPSIYRLLMVEPKVIVFEPRDTLEQPQTISELFTALRNILQGLVALHSYNRMHRDIRWPNVMKRLDGSGWFLIEFNHMSLSPNYVAVPMHLCTDEHAPEMAHHEHNTAVDIWSVGYLILSSEVPWEERRCLFSFSQWLLQIRPDERPNANEALAKLLALEKAETEKTQG